MHILLIHQAFVTINEPGGTRHHELARVLAQQGHQVSIIASPISYLTGKTSSTLKKEVDEFGVTIYRTYTYPALHRSFFHRLISFFSFMHSSFFRAIKIHKVDMVWGTSPPIFQGFTAWLVARLKGVPFAFEVRDLWPAFAIAVGVLKNPLIIRLSKWLEKFLYRHADLVIVNSPGYIEYVSQHGANKIALVPNGVDTAMFPIGQNGEVFREQHHLDGKFLIFYTGAHGISNDLQVLIEAAELCQENEQIHFVLLGDGKEKPALMQMAAEKKLENISFLPPVEKKEMGLALSAADCCIAILKPIEMYKTTYPNKVFDYMAAGKAIILAIDGVIRQVVDEAQCGIFVPPGNATAMADAIQQLYQSPDKCKKMGIHGRVYVEDHYDRQKTAEQLLSVFLQLEKKK
ncbi:MAG TPA: glycosyltransferase WbuB [Anaerolineaceae bacterium]|uniref:Putative glycosyltransferase n=1 Tax=Anaerolinea thermophila TaxID=167964 RepID=A0A101FYN9_9CHLR|nr:MAG: Putative glycosyltransferase [Anaerolinea thermophila]HAF61829.1 glycosyltransferase WbuB [Anaerolineaceae bacterium]